MNEDITAIIDNWQERYGIIYYDTASSSDTEYKKL